MIARPSGFFYFLLARIPSTLLVKCWDEWQLVKNNPALSGYKMCANKKLKP